MNFNQFDSKYICQAVEEIVPDPLSGPLTVTVRAGHGARHYICTYRITFNPHNNLEMGII